MVGGVYVQFGCGFSGPDRWLNFDASPTLLAERLPLIGRFIKRNSNRFPDSVHYGDIVKGLPVAKESADAVYASHVLEHLTRQDCYTAIANTFGMLKPGGRFRLIVPDLEWRAKKYLAAVEASDPEGSHGFMFDTHLGAHERRGLSARLGNSAHLWMWDERSMTDALRKAGFESIRRCQIGDSGDPMFDLVEDPERFAYLSYSELAMEAIRPL